MIRTRVSLVRRAIAPQANWTTCDTQFSTLVFPNIG